MKGLLLLVTLCALPVSVLGKIVSGTVTDERGNALAFANVLLYQRADSVFLHGTTTNHEGYFELKVEDPANSFLRVSYVGYQTRNIAIADTVTRVVLTPLSLGEVVVTGDMIRKSASAEVYYITDSLRRVSANALQLLDRLRGVNVDWSTEGIKIGEYRDVPILVEGRNVGIEYIRDLNPKRIRKIEILRDPKGKYDDVPIVVNVILNNAYTGYDIGVSAKGMLSMRGTPSYSTHEGMTFTYATNRWNLYGDVGFNGKKMYEAVSYEHTYKDYAERTALEDYRDPNNSNRLTDSKFCIGTDYKITQRHVVSLQTWVDVSDSKNKEAYDDRDENFLSASMEDYSATDVTTGLFYRGKVWRKTGPLRGRDLQLL